MSQTAAQADVVQLVTFVIEGEEFGIDILKVQEIIRPVAITRVPNAPPFVEGVINLRGRIVPVIDARKRFGLTPRDMTDASRIVVIELGAETVGFVMDAVREVIRVDPAAIEPAPDLAVGVDADYIRGVAKLDDRLLILLDVDRVLAANERDALAEAAPSDREAVAA